MEFWRTASNPWGQEVLLGVSWDLMWAALILGIVFVVGHAFYVATVKSEATGDAGGAEGAAAAGIPARILRHATPARVFHWLMSVAMFVLLVTAFFPLVGIRFPWVTIHWIAGIGLLATVVYHIVYATLRENFRSMVIDGDDIKEGTRGLARFFGRTGAPAPKAGKYPVDHKLYHHTISVVTIAAVVTGLLMMVRVDTPFWARNPYLLSDATWGLVYVVHGLSGVALITLVIAHVYFAVRPEKWWITKSMINGWIGREDYLSHHDPEKWVVGEATARPVAGVGASGGLPEGVARDKRAGD